jgi:hypothetical protein
MVCAAAAACVWVLHDAEEVRMYVATWAGEGVVLKNR